LSYGIGQYYLKEKVSMATPFPIFVWKELRDVGGKRGWWCVALLFEGSLDYRVMWVALSWEGMLD